MPSIRVWYGIKRARGQGQRHERADAATGCARTRRSFARLAYPDPHRADRRLADRPLAYGPGTAGHDHVPYRGRDRSRKNPHQVQEPRHRPGGGRAIQQGFFPGRGARPPGQGSGAFPAPRHALLGGQADAQRARHFRPGNASVGRLHRDRAGAGRAPVALRRARIPAGRQRRRGRQADHAHDPPARLDRPGIPCALPGHRSGRGARIRNGQRLSQRADPCVREAAIRPAGAQQYAFLERERDRSLDGPRRNAGENGIPPGAAVRRHRF